MDEFIALHREHCTPEGRDVLQRLSRLPGVERVPEFAAADLRQHGRSFEERRDPVQQKLFQSLGGN